MVSAVTHQVWTASNGIASDFHLARFFAAELKKINLKPQVFHNDLVVGWGNKANTQKAKLFAEQHDLLYIRLEDGFIGYLWHSQDKPQRLSLIKDKTGIYYDARSSSDLEQLCVTARARTTDGSKGWFTQALELRAQNLITELTQSGISKYNHQRCALPDWLEAQANGSVILVVDQTAGDISVEQGLGSKESFATMIEDALTAHPDQMIVVKTHPDVIKGKKQGFLNIEACSHPNVYLLSDDCAIRELMAKVEQIYTVTSQLGFEGLLYGVPVHCYGMPFYAGWGLTLDRQTCARRSVKVSLPQLVAAALIQYPDYMDPQTGEICQVEVIIEWLALQLAQQSHSVDICYAFGFSLWKRAFIKPFIGRMARQVVFVQRQDKLARLIHGDANVAVLLWGKSQAVWAQTLRQSCPVWFMEDGFIRSVGLGADLRRPSCLVIDKKGMYYSPDAPSDIVDILNTVQLTPKQVARTELLTAMVVERALSKYNVGQKLAASSVLDKIAQYRHCTGDVEGGLCEVILVPGQFEQDQSIVSSRGKIKSNLQLLRQVRLTHPQAFIMFKEHPDLYSGVRPGALGENAALEYADVYLSDVDIVTVLNVCDRVCTMTSLTGFEALLRHKKVTTYGSPFYAGWGLTTDDLSFPERRNRLDLNQLIYATLVSYPSYVDWGTGVLTSVERVIAVLTQERTQYEQQGVAGQQLSSSWLARFSRKVKYFYEAYRL
ncbi:capsular polysaccharide biosynthesis protein [Shewanella sp. VB17]|uniref:capsular polysaccharide biosynthesis protein n=1 Tax=Shewanella sp. VB17 TaxID=2739432 RepID=UPI001566F690|nr:capsular polysaccharide biosynthesis protein [Shewanella sp. VB17]NRD72382.1 capsular polysaccharide biosynthesis protein [Shewanella sp. VB17]